MEHWIETAVFYHVYPLGYCGAPSRNDRSSPPEPRLDALTARLASIADLGANALYLGPVFESVAHGYDTVDHRAIDRRLGDAAAMRRLCDEARRLGMKVVLDGVFNHVGRGHPWFLALRERGPGSEAAAFFARVDPAGRSPCGDPFSYACWNGCADLPRLDLANAALRRELVEAALSWIDDYGVDGIRLDAADQVAPAFQAELAAACRARKPGFWLLGEVVLGDYRSYLEPGRLDSVTNYECWKGLWSSMNDVNLHEIAYSLNRQFGPGGLYEGRLLYSFSDNHDVERVASKLRERRRLYPLTILLFTMPGIPSIYYGSEFGVGGRKEGPSDAALRPSIVDVERSAAGAEPDLARAIRRLAALRKSLGGLRARSYRQLHVGPATLAFERSGPAGRVTVAVNAGDGAVDMSLPVPPGARRLVDALSDGGESFQARDGLVRLRVHPNWGRILVEA